MNCIECVKKVLESEGVLWASLSQVELDMIAMNCGAKIECYFIAKMIINHRHFNKIRQLLEKTNFDMSKIDDYMEWITIELTKNSLSYADIVKELVEFHRKNEKPVLGL